VLVGSFYNLSMESMAVLMDGWTGVRPTMVVCSSTDGCRQTEQQHSTDDDADHGDGILHI
jgi:hypothetical protein